MDEIPELPFDLVCYILLGVPVKTLHRFQCVSKLWCSLISDPRFQREHYHRSQQSPLLLLISGYSEDTLVHFKTYNDGGSFLRKFSTDEIPESPWPVGEKHVSFQVVQSCLELVCFKLYFDESIRLCNPSTQEIIVLPAHPEEHFNICLGFGYAASTEEYKVVRFFSLEPYYEENFCEVFTLGTNDGWREVRSPPYQPRYDAHLPFLHGALHLLPDINIQEQKDHYIAAFDVNTEEYRGLPFPEIYFRQGSSEMRSNFTQLAALGGTLCLTFAFTVLKKMLELWFLKDYHSGIWVKQYNIDLSSISYIVASPLAIILDGSILLKIIRKNSNALRLYNTQDNSLGERETIDSEATLYFESFISLGSRVNHHMDMDQIVLYG